MWSILFGSGGSSVSKHLKDSVKYKCGDNKGEVIEGAPREGGTQKPTHRRGLWPSFCLVLVLHLEPVTICWCRRSSIVHGGMKAGFK